MIHQAQISGTSDFLLGNDHSQPSLHCRQDGSVEQIHSCRELTEQPKTSAPVYCRESHTPKWQLSSMFLLDDVPIKDDTVVEKWAKN